MWLPWQEQTLHSFSLVVTFILVNLIYQKCEEYSIHIILDVIAVLSFYRILPSKR